jgi:thiol-disulfide isomerase/thioredoxin
MSALKWYNLRYMDQKTSYIAAAVIGILLIGGFVFLGSQGGFSKPAPVENASVTAFATCLKEKGATFYGAFWCPHCQAQKKLFGASAKDLPYVECSTPDGQAQLPICKEKNISSYPTWVFADGTISTGELTFEQLAEKTGCTAPVIGS